MPVSIKGGAEAIAASHRRLAEQRRGDPALPEISTEQIEGQMSLGVDRVMSEGALYDRRLAARAIKQAQGDMIEAIFLLRAFRTTLRRFGASAPLDGAAMLVRRRVSTVYKDPPGGQFLGATYDYTHRLLDFSDKPANDEPANHKPTLAAEPPAPRAATDERIALSPFDVLREDGLLADETDPQSADPVADLTRSPLAFPSSRDLRLQALARADEGFLLGLAAASMHGYGRAHPYVADLRVGETPVRFTIPELGIEIVLAHVTVTECRTVTQTEGGASDQGPAFTEGYGLAFGKSERKAIAIALVERALRAKEFGEEAGTPAQDEEFVLPHADNVASAGLIQHLKLPHYVDFQGRLKLLRKLRERAQPARTAEAEKAIV